LSGHALFFGGYPSAVAKLLLALCIGSAGSLKQDEEGKMSNY
jgi:hypothetical protein